MTPDPDEAARLDEEAVLLVETDNGLSAGDPEDQPSQDRAVLP